MRQYLFKTLVFCIGISMVCSCIDPYNPPTTTADPGYLVVDGFLNATEKCCTIKLTHTYPISKDTSFVPPVEANAIVQIEDGGGAIFSLPEISKGEYSATNLNLSISGKYRLNITTTGKKEYVSDFVPIVQTPAVDSITYGNERTGVHVEVNTHDPNNNTHYYLWNYTETWLYHSAFNSQFIYKNGNVLPRDESVYSCWKNEKSSTILINSSTKLKEDIISDFPLTVIPWNSTKLLVRYSILVAQRGLTQAAYEYLQQVKKNTENLGTLFGPLPSRVTGNIQCTTNSEEPVLGYFTASTVQQKRKFINSKDIIRPLNLPYVITGFEGCKEGSALFISDTIITIIKSDTIRKKITYLDTTFITSFYHNELTTGIYNGNSLIGYYISIPYCVDCTLGGGTTTQPDFWK